MASEPMAPKPTDDELVEMIYQTLMNLHYMNCQAAALAVLARIRPHLEARGIEMAAKFAEQVEVEHGMCGAVWADGAEIARGLRAFARRHAEGGKNG